MTEGGISKLDAAGHQLDCAIRLLLEANDSICADTLRTPLTAFCGNCWGVVGRR